MLDYVYGQDAIVADFVAQLIPHVGARGFGACKAMGVVDGDGKLVAGIVYHDWNPEAGVIMMSGAALPKTRWLTRETLRRMYEYPFVQIGAQMVIKVVPAANERLLRQLAALGFSFVMVPRLLGRDRDGVLCFWTREAWEVSKFIRRPERAFEEAA